MPLKIRFILSILVTLLFNVPTAAQSPRICLSDSLPKPQKGDSNLAQGVFRTSSKWLPGQKLRVRFLDGDEFLRSKVRQFAQIWEQYANIDFVFVDSGPAEIRVSFELEKGAAWSFVGKASLTSSVRRRGATTETYYGGDGASMNFGWFGRGTSDTEFRRTILHEFGHALGLLHEHQNSNASFQWNRPVVFNYFMNELGWSREKVESAVLSRYGRGTEFSNRAYDKDSIMHYSVDPSFTIGGFGVGNNTTLSTGDRLLIAEMYPFEVKKYDSEFKFKNIAIDYNVTEQNQKGLRFLVDFDINNAQHETHMLAAYFYTADGKLLKDNNNKFRARDGSVSVFKSFKPMYLKTVFTKFPMFIPYTEFDLPCGDYRLKYVVYAWQDSTRVANSGSSYFTYRKPC